METITTNQGFQKWEYLKTCDTSYTFDERKELEHQFGRTLSEEEFNTLKLNEYGKLGWELVTTQGSYWYFKRPL